MSRLEPDSKCEFSSNPFKADILTLFNKTIQYTTFRKHFIKFKYRTRQIKATYTNK